MNHLETDNLARNLTTDIFTLLNHDPGRHYHLFYGFIFTINMPLSRPSGDPPDALYRTINRVIDRGIYTKLLRKYSNTN